MAKGTRKSVGLAVGDRALAAVGIRFGQSITTVPADFAVYVQGAPSDDVFYLRKGHVKISVLSRSGREAVITILGPGHFFGLTSMTGVSRRLGTVTSITECEIEQIKVSAIRAALRNDPEFAEEFVEELLLQIRLFQEDILDHHFYSTEKRLARALLRLANVDRAGARGGRSSGVSQAMLANMIGTTRSRVNVFMNKFRRLGMIQYSGKLDDNFIVYRSLAGILSHE